ncbi:CoA-binding protein [Ketogulonicigenium vulgare]|uniref:Succinyl-CoA synthetase alpha subunit-related enzyme n=1 Tax=Ketogulonicigenium vulgare (strain WSH-001) TaxID=759362 RepID=F9Y415_KETVW|nr:CoA-binding protein [Ketogulonicigenium vulgare]ADO43424.1 CoA-binding domain protein [Ketogulonicigenium vulgare Y25]AEM41706.1 succinyl-CoA synthetase alpha subunit-related enzyme [Ketogulonicigenium vulgare WSH-001]ALJ81816.1 succinyl-CoA synthetase subunit alpha [Ketogulonicigenium vulgare]ANW34470.1 succinyl-CoA synthetase subunit alpha [Ketogulonicigenium vulgare]AOZ55459.1 CoA-binding domain protein [Ketogulonicigenium vulgare]
MSTEKHAPEKKALEKARRIAIVGFSANPARPSHSVARFLQAAGYDLVLVNPGLAGQDHLGTKVVATLAEAGRIDLVDVFRNSHAIPALVDELLALPYAPHTLWLQLGITNLATLAASEAGIAVVEDRCTAIEYQRHFGASRINP